MLENYDAKDAETIEDIEVGFMNYPPDLQITFQSGETYKFNANISMTQKLENNYGFKNSYSFTTAIIPYKLLELLESGSHQIKEVKIIEIVQTTHGEKLTKTHCISYPLFSMSRFIDCKGMKHLWTIKISDKL